MTVGYGGLCEGNVGDQSPGLKVPSDLEIAAWPRDEDVADDERDLTPQLELPMISPERGPIAIGVPVDQTE